MVDDGSSYRDYQDEKISQLQDEVRRLRHTLSKIKDHVEWMGGAGMARASGIWNLAHKALQGSEQHAPKH